MLWKKESQQAKKERWKALSYDTWRNACQWHTWFAWYPVEIAPNQTAWLHLIERRLDKCARNTQPEWYTWDLRGFEYRIKQNG